MANCMKTHDNIIRLGNLDFSGDWVAYDSKTANPIFDSRTDGGDCPPLLTLCPVTWMSIKDGVFCFELLTEWEGV